MSDDNENPGLGTWDQSKRFVAAELYRSRRHNAGNRKAINTLRLAVAVLDTKIGFWSIVGGAAGGIVSTVISGLVLWYILHGVK